MTDHKVVDIATGKPTERNYPVEEMDFRRLVIRGLEEQTQSILLQDMTIKFLVNSMEEMNGHIVKLEGAYCKVTVCQKSKKWFFEKIYNRRKT